MTTLVLVVWAVLMQAAQSRPETRPTSPADSTEFAQRLRQLDERGLQVRDVSARFNQVKHTALLKEPMHSEGTVRITRNGQTALMRWDTAKPHPSTIVTTQSELQIYYPRQSLLEIYPIESGLAQLAGSPLPQLEFARKHFTIDECPWEGLDISQPARRLAVRLTPIEERLREHVLEVRVLIDTEAACVVNAEIDYPDNERLVLEFSQIRVNTGIQERELRLNVGPDVEVTRPLDPNARNKP